MFESMSWQPSALIETLRLRAALMRRVRAFFEARGVLEVETPLLSRSAITDPNLASAAVVLPGSSDTYYLHTSPEFFMKRLLAAGSGDIWQTCKVFRGAEQGRRHNPEFTMLEWYRLGFDHHALMDEVATLLRELIPGLEQEERLTYSDAFLKHANLDPFIASREQLEAAVQDFGLNPDGLDRDALLDAVAGNAVYPKLGHAGIAFVHAFPASQAALARLDEQDARYARRFEVFVKGIELANGFHELTDAHEQRRRFEQENERRRALGLPEMPLDENLLAALESGLPDCAGVALGFDRVVMLAAGVDELSDTMGFGFDRV
ncbi:MAG: EF-P lysine aminoacylase GenX [Proteobacteria bacterium]|nr:EF-P lysine aminoacylase GenX [Pseudomonadota bacterium]